MKKIYIAGCGGMLGEAFYHQFGKDYELKCTDIDVNDDWLSYLDFRDLPASIWVPSQTWNTVNYTRMTPM